VSLRDGEGAKRPPFVPYPYTERPMFDALADKLQSALGDLKGRGTLDEEAISRAMR